MKSNQLNWKTLAAIDQSTFEEDIDRGKWPIKEIAVMLASFDIHQEFDTNAIEDQNLIKVLKLIQILLARSINELIKYNHHQQDIDRNKDLLNENRKLRKLIHVHQQAFPYTDAGSTKTQIQCPQCPKAFYDYSFLKTHIMKRHPSYGLDSEGPLSLTQRITQYHNDIFDNKTVNQMKKELIEIKEKLDKTESDLQEEKEARLKLEDLIEIEVADKVKEMEENLREHQIIPSNDSLSKPEQVLKDEKDKNQDIIMEAPLSPTHNGSWNNQIEHIMMENTHQVKKLSTSLDMLLTSLHQNSQRPSKISSKKLKMKPESDEKDPIDKAIIPKKRIKNQILIEHPKSLNVDEMLENKITELEIESLSGSRLDEASYNKAMKILKKMRKKKIEASSFNFHAIRKFISNKVNEEALERMDSSYPSNNAIMFKTNISDKKKEKENQKENEKIEQENHNQVKQVKNQVKQVTVKPAPRISVGKTDYSKAVSKEMTSEKESEETLIQVQNPKPVLKSSLIQPNLKDLNNKKHIRFSDHRIEISPEDTTDESEIEIDPSFDPKQSASLTSQMIPVPTPRSLTSEVKKESASIHWSNDEDDEDDGSELSDDAMARPPKVQELTQLIEKQLNKRRAISNPPPAGSLDTLS